MSYIFDISDNHGLAIYTYQQQILLCDKNGRFFGRPVILAGDYAEQLNAAVFQDTIYYTYITTENQLVLRSILSEQLIFKIDTKTLPAETTSDAPLPAKFISMSTHNTDCLPVSPQLIIFNDRLLLFYISFSQVRNSYSVHCSAPLDKKEDFIIGHPFFPLPHITISPAKNYLMLHIVCKKETHNIIVKTEALSSINPLTNFKNSSAADNSDELYIFDEKMHVTSITEQKNIIMSDCERKLEQATHNHDKEKKHWEQTLQTYSVKINQLEQTSQVDKAEIEHLKHISQVDKAEIDRLNAIINSITHQYNELMNVAQQYRNEAKKWHDMLLARNE